MTSRRKQSIDEVRVLLEQRDLEGLMQWAERTRSPMSILVSFIYEKGSLIAWRAVEALGKVALPKFELDNETVHNMIRRLFWSMNDDSGSVGWHAAEAVGEILCNVPRLIDDYGRILASLHGQEPFREGVFWSMARMAEQKPKPFSDMTEDLDRALSDPSPSIRAHAALALASLKEQGAKEKIEAMTDDKSEFTIYDFEKGDLITATVSQKAKQALNRF